MTDRDREAFEAWWKTADRVVLDRYWAEEAWEAALDHAREAGAQEPVAVPEGYWLAPLTLTPELRAAGAAGSGEDSEAVAEGAYEAIRDAVLAAAPVSPAAESGEVERLRTLVEQAQDIFTHCNVEDGVCCCGDEMKTHADPMSCGHSPVDHGGYVADQWVKEAREALASHTPAPQPGGAVKVKALTWKDGPSHSGMQVAECVFGEYWAWDAGSGCWSRGSLPGRLVPGGMKGAQTAAQADYERRILSALEPSPSQWNAGAEAKVREALEWYAEQVAGCRKLGNIGDPARHELDRDGGKRAREALAALPLPTPAGEG